MNAESLITGCNMLSRPAEEFGNNEMIEYLWVKKATEHAEIHFNLLCAVDAKYLRLTPIDDEIYRLFNETFPNLNVESLDENEMKSEEQKKLWRDFCETFKGIVVDYDFGTLLRLRCDDKYGEANTTLVPRIQFYAIEIARNKRGFNDWIRKTYPRGCNWSN